MGVLGDITVLHSRSAEMIDAGDVALPLPKIHAKRRNTITDTL